MPPPGGTLSASGRFESAPAAADHQQSPIPGMVIAVLGLLVGGAVLIRAALGLPDDLWGRLDGGGLGGGPTAPQPRSASRSCSHSRRSRQLRH
jgi:hypothetical protein